MPLRHVCDHQDQPLEHGQLLHAEPTHVKPVSMATKVTLGPERLIVNFYMPQSAYKHFFTFFDGPHDLNQLCHSPQGHVRGHHGHLLGPGEFNCGYLYAPISLPALLY